MGRYGVPFPCAEVKIIDQCARVKKRNASIATVFYYNAVLDWYFYHADTVLQLHPEWQLNDSFTGKTAGASCNRTRPSLPRWPPVLFSFVFIVSL
jgi:hypothetical protein